MPNPPLAPVAPLHPRNRHRGRYDFAQLIACSPGLKRFVRPNPHGDPSIDFADPAAVTALNAALLRADYHITDWEIPPGFLVPAIPGRADYIHHVADLLADRAGDIPRGAAIRVLDLGVGASCIYPLLGVAEYGWHFTGTDIDAAALASAQQILDANPALAGRIELRLQPSPAQILTAVVRPGERFDVSLCNPPFHASAAAALAGTRRKLRNLTGRTIGKAKTVLNFGGRNQELWTAGGELGFIRRMIAESATMPNACRWFTTLVSKAEHLAPLRSALASVRAAEIRVVPMSQGQKISRILAWSFRPPAAPTPPRQISRSK